MPPITPRACMMLKVNHHKHHYNGTICSHPTRWRCGANAGFRQNRCAQGQASCFDMYLFHHTDPHVRRRSDVDSDGYLGDMRDVIDDGEHPLVFLWTYTSNNSRILVGLYVVGGVEESLLAFNGAEYDLRPVPGMALYFDDPELTNEFLWRHSIGTEFYFRSVSETYVPMALNDILHRQRQLLEESKRRSDLQGKTKSFEHNVKQLAQIITYLGHLPEAEHDEDYLDGAVLAALPSGAVSTPTEPVKVEYPSDPVTTVVNSVSSVVQPTLVDGMATVLNAVRAKTRQRGLYYPDDLIKRYHLSLQTKPFVILAGVSGGGKTQLALAYAEALGAELAVVSVGSNWTSNEALLGAYDVLNDRFVPTEFTTFLSEAEAEYRDAQDAGREPRPYCVVLDEMNLSHVEYYFSDFLSKMELPEERRYVILHTYPGKDVPPKVMIPPNLLITGTVNVDETTHRFSPKVLDRANFIRLDDINLQEMLNLVDYWSPVIYNKDQAREVTSHLRSMNTVLTKSQQHFGYRTAREIITWVDRATGAGAFAMGAALDMQILQKVLVKVQGSKFNPTERQMIQELVVFLEDTLDPSTQQPQFPESTKRIKRMLDELNEEEFTFGQQ